VDVGDVLRKVFMVSFDRSSDRIIDHLVPILSSTPYPIYYRTTEMDEYKVLGQETPVWDEEDFNADDMIGEDRAIYTSLSGGVDPSKSPVTAHLLRTDEITMVEDMADPVERGDLVLSFIDISSRDRSMVAAYFSSLVISREAFSLCLVTVKERMQNVKHLEKLNREFLDLSMSFHGLVAIPNRVIRSGNYINIAHMVRHMVEMNFRSGVINLDQADLLTTSRGGSVLIMTWGAARPGGNPAATSTKDALSNPLCDIDLSTIRKALINVTGPSDLALEDSLVASEVLRKRTKDNARIIWGVNILQDLGEDMEVFIILSTTPMELLLHWYSKQ
jgi:hypothetical protein